MRELFGNSLHICVTRCGTANICAVNRLYVFGDVAELINISSKDCVKFKHLGPAWRCDVFIVFNVFLEI